MNENKQTYTDDFYYEGFPYVSFINPVTRNVLISREKTLNRLNVKTPWVSLTSGIKKINSTQNDSSFTRLEPIISKGNSTYNYGFEELYDVDSGYRPFPGIVSVEVKYLSKYGGVREATVNWTINSIDQFEKYAPYFMTPGIAVLLEYGWQDDINTYKLPESEYYLLKENPEFSWNVLREKSILSNCAYDAMHGIIKNFSFSLNQNGGYDCSTSIISGGALMYGLSMVDQSITKKQKDDKENIYDKSIKLFVEKKLDKYLERFFDIISEKTKKREVTKNISQGTINTFGYSTIPIEDNTEEDTVEVRKFKKENEMQYISQDDVKAYQEIKTKTAYITWGFIEEVIVNRNLSTVLQNNEDKLLYEIKSKEFLEKNIYGISTRIFNDEFLRSTNLKVCFLPQGRNLKKFKEIDLKFYPIKNSKPIVDNDKSEMFHGLIRNIYINVEVVKKAFLNSDNLSDALLKILEKVNSACANVWKFSLKIRESDQKMIVIDENYTNVNLEKLLNNNKLENIYKFSTFGGNSIIKEINFESSLPNSVAMTSMYSKHTTTEEGSGDVILNSTNDSIKTLFGTFEFNDELYPKLKIKKETKDISDYNEPEKTKAEDISLNKDENNANFSEDFRYAFLPEDGWIERESAGSIYVAEDNITHEKAMKMKMLKNSIDKKGDSQFNDMIVPGELTIRIEGIAGLRIGDVFMTDVLPDDYIKRTVFQISAVDHSIDNSKWDTTITAKMRVLNSKIDASSIRNSRNKYDNRASSIINKLKSNEIDKNVLSWIKNKIGPVIRKNNLDIFSEDIIAGIIYTETGGIIARKYKNQTADPNEIVKDKEFIGDNGNSYSFYQIHRNTANDWIEKDNITPTWSSINESTKKAISILINKKQALADLLEEGTYNEIDASISAYNQGQGNVARKINIPDYGTTYLSKVKEAAIVYRDV